MLPHTAKAIIAQQQLLSTWKSDVRFSTDHGDVDLSLGMGPHAMPLHGLPYQPNTFPTGTTYCFDTRKYRGAGAAKHILHDVASSVIGCAMHSHSECTSSTDALFSTYSLRCSFCAVAPNYSDKHFSETSFARMGTRTEPLKRRRESDKLAPDRMDTFNMKRSRRKRKRKHSPTKKTNSQPDEPPSKRRTLGTKALTTDTKCCVRVSIRNYHLSGNWYLSKHSCVTHMHHTRLDPTHQRVRRKDISTVESDFAQVMHDNGSNIDSITRVMNHLRYNTSIAGMIRKKTMRNLIRKNKLDLDALKGIPRDWNVADKTLAYLKDMNASYIALVMDEQDNLLVYKGKGRHTLKEANIISTDGDLRKKLAKLRRTLKLTKTCQVLLGLSVATDNMIRAMHMNPEVLFLDVAANMNSQKREMFFAVVKGATGQTFIVNATVMPCGQGWIFQKIYETFFLYLYGKAAIERIQLVLTDDDPSSHGALAHVKILDKCWEDVVHMLCVFHGLIMAFHKIVWPKLPHKRGNPYELTNKGKAYCTSLRSVWSYILSCPFVFIAPLFFAL